MKKYYLEVDIHNHFCDNSTTTGLAYADSGFFMGGSRTSSPGYVLTA